MPVEPVFLARPRIEFVTGATGLLGNNLVRELLADAGRFGHSCEL